MCLPIIVYIELGVPWILEIVFISSNIAKGLDTSWPLCTACRLASGMTDGLTTPIIRRMTSAVTRGLTSTIAGGLTSTATERLSSTFGIRMDCTVAGGMASAVA